MVGTQRTIGNLYFMLIQHQYSICNTTTFTLFMIFIKHIMPSIPRPEMSSNLKS